MTYSSADQPGGSGQPYQPPPYPYPYASPYQPAAQPRRRGRTPLLLALIFGVAGIALLIAGGVIGFKQGLQKVDSFQRVSVAQGTGTVNFAAGNFVAYYEAPNYNSNGNTVPVVRMALQNAQTGQAVQYSLYGGANRKVRSLSYDYHGHRGAALYQFTITQPGRYRVALQAVSPDASPRADIAFGKSIATGLAVGGVLAAIGALLLLTALILLIVGLVQRSRSRKQVAGAQAYGGPPPGYGYPPPGQGGWPPQ